MSAAAPVVFRGRWQSGLTPASSASIRRKTCWRSRATKPKSATSIVEAAAEEVPLPDGCADVVFMSMILHHLVDRERAAQECRRLLRPDGCLCVRNSTRDSRYPQRRFFPGIGAMIERELPSRDDVVALFESAGLRLSTYRRVAHPVATSWAEFADKLALRADSFLARLPASRVRARHDRAARARRRGPTAATGHRGRSLVRF